MTATRQKTLIFLATAAAILLIAPAALAYSRADTALVSDRTALDYTVVRTYSGTEATNERKVADTNNNGAVTQAEADAYTANLTATSLNNATGSLRWDNAATSWSSLNITTSGLANHAVNQNKLTITLSGTVNLTSAVGLNHTATILPPSGAAADFSLSVPSNWTIVNVTGATITSSSPSAVTGNVAAGGLALIQIAEALPPFDDTLPPTLDAGGDRTALAGAPTALNGTASDDDPVFPVGASFFWTFLYNGTPVNLSGRDVSFTFWTLGTYTLTFTAVDRSGNRAATSINVTVLSPDTVAPVLGPPQAISVEAGTPITILGNTTDDDPAYPAGARFSWTFAHNGTPFVVSSEDLTFTFWKLGVYSLNFSATDGWGNTATTTVTVTVVSPDTVPPTLGPPSEVTVEAGTPLSILGNTTDNDPAYPAGARFAWSFAYNGTPVTVAAENLSFTFWRIGTYGIMFTATDGWGNAAAATVRVTVVSPDTVPPTIEPAADLAVDAGTPFTLALNVSDNDPSFPSGATFLWTFVYNSTALNIPSQTLAFTFWAIGTFPLTFSVADGWGNLNTTIIRLTVERPDKLPPSIDLGAARSVLAGTPITLTAQVSDNDPSFPAGAALYWTFTYDSLPVNLSGASASFNFMKLGPFPLTFTAVDAWGNRAQSTLMLTVLSPDTSPPTVDAGADVEAVQGDTVAFHASAADNDPAFSSGAAYFWTFTYNNESINLSGKDPAFKFDFPGTYEVQLEVRDPWGNTAYDVRKVTVNGASNVPGPSAASPGGFGLLLPAVLMGAAAVSAIGVGAYRRRERDAAEAESTHAEAAQAEAAAAVLASPPPAGPTHVVEGLLILYKDGRLIHHQSAAGEAGFESPEVLGAMFTAVTEFIRDSFGQEGALSRLTYGQNTILLDRSAHLFGAVIVYGEPDQELADNLRDCLRRMESAYAGVVERWFGDRDAFAGIDSFTSTIFAATVGLTRGEVRAASGEKTVKLVSGTEHYKGYVRLRVAIANQTDGRLTDATVTVVFNQNVLRLAKIEPAGLEHQGLTVRIGDVGPGERAGAIYYLDPQTCSRTNIEGIAAFRDASGVERTVPMKPRTEEIVCPIFFTPHHANPGMMKRLIENSLAARDSKLYRVLSLPAGTGYKDLFGIVREAVQRHHVVLVRNIATGAPFDGKAWFYGQTKHSKSPVIIRATVSESRRAVEIFVAVDSPATLTGLLAEFNRSFTEMVNARMPEATLEPVLEDSLKGLMSADEFARAEDQPNDP